MLKLEATLVATTAVRPWRSGWSPDHGIDFIVWSPGRQAIPATPPEAGRRVASEPASFLDGDDITPGTTVVKRYVSLAAARAAETAAREPVDLPLTRAWCSMARKVPGS
ncbi:hypothetical protein [Brevundimonas sp.]|uniref:hypothetical protein n=1 Tax=Brevundimonas sp. TaxID=1871086 RepID=UPI002FCB0B40